MSGSSQEDTRQSSTSVKKEIKKAPQPLKSSSTPKISILLTIKNISAILQDLLQRYNILGAPNPQSPIGFPPPNVNFNTLGPSGPPDLPGFLGINAGSSEIKWNASDIGFLNLTFEGKSVQTGVEIEHTS